MRCGSAVIVTLLSLLLTVGCASPETAVEPTESAAQPAPPTATATAPPAEETPDPIENMAAARTVPARAATRNISISGATRRAMERTP